MPWRFLSVVCVSDKFLHGVDVIAPQLGEATTAARQAGLTLCHAEKLPEEQFVPLTDGATSSYPDTGARPKLGPDRSVALLTDERIEMTDWDLAVQIVRDELQKDSKEAHHLTSPAKAY